jgi:hypothetical protein
MEKPSLEPAFSRLFPAAFTGRIRAKNKPGVISITFATSAKARLGRKPETR